MTDTPRRWVRPARIAAQVVLGLGLGLAIAEAVFTWRADGAFPHVNFYVADPELGVRLQPGAQMRFGLGRNPVREIHVNAQGYRGRDWPSEPAPHEILVVGDSQVFGLGVGDDETFSARLAEASGRPVLNAGVPTYGPLEYLAITEEILAQRRPETVVYVINFLNDPFELERPNRERHTVWDGWAVRSETAPAEVFEFPGRRWLFSRSHLVYAVRRWLNERDGEGADAIDLGTASEGDWQDLVVETARADFDRSHQDIAELARAQPGDIVRDRESESSRSVAVTAEQIRKAAQERDAYVAVMVRTGGLVRSASVFDAHLAELARVCEQHGAEWIVVALPVDVQVSAEEWAKYGVHDPPDMQPSLALLEDLLTAADTLGARTLDATPALRSAEPGAFLDGDIHMTAKGHAAVAEALAEVLNGSPDRERLPRIHVVESGDSLWKLAQGHTCTAEQLAEHNGMKVDGVLKIGAEIDLSICNRSTRD